MHGNGNLQTVYAEIETGMKLPKCHKCGCMQETLDTLVRQLPKVGTDEARQLAQSIVDWSGQMQPVEYACLGCQYCYPAVAQNDLAAAFPSLGVESSLHCDFQEADAGWPPVVGEYTVLDSSAPVAVSTLASVELAEELAGQKPAGLAIVGKTETENIGIDKIIKNTITNQAIQFLLLAGQDSTGHQTGQTLLALAHNGIDSRRRVIDSPGKRPVLRNVSAAEIDHFRAQVQLIDMIGCEEPSKIVARIGTLAQEADISCNCSNCADQASPATSASTVKVVNATASGNEVKMDRAGYFVIVPLVDKGVLNVEHYAYDHTLLHVIEGQTARDLYLNIINSNWVTELSHAAYLGKELAKAELSLSHNFKYVQDGA